MTKPVGRPSNFNEEVSNKIIELTYKGKTLSQIADIIGVSVMSIYTWKKHHKEFSYALNEARQDIDELIEASLFRRALGYSHVETKLFVINNEIVEHKITKHYPPDTTSMIYWLKNRQPGRWRDLVDDMTDDEKTKELKKLSINQLLTIVKKKEKPVADVG